MEFTTLHVHIVICHEIYNFTVVNIDRTHCYYIKLFKMLVLMQRWLMDSYTHN